MASTSVANEDPIYHGNEASSYTGIPLGTLRYYASTGAGPKSFKLGGRRVYRKSALDAWISEAERKSEVSA